MYSVIKSIVLYCIILYYIIFYCRRRSRPGCLKSPLLGLEMFRSALIAGQPVQRTTVVDRKSLLEKNKDFLSKNILCSKPIEADVLK